MRANRANQNASRLGVSDRMQVVEGRSIDKIADLPDPDAVFIGGGATAEVIAATLPRIKTGGRLVIHAVTLETEQVLFNAYKEHGGDLSRMEVSSIEAIGTFTGWHPARPITQWVWQAN